MQVGDTTASDDFIEVHIYGPLDRDGIEHVSGPKPVAPADDVISKDLRRKLDEINVTHEF